MGEDLYIEKRIQQIYIRFLKHGFIRGFYRYREYRLPIVSEILRVSLSCGDGNLMLGSPEPEFHIAGSLCVHHIYATLFEVYNLRRESW